ncbi:RidA family protein [Actinomadura rubrisoli]|uniref:RidA family protein n=1 Tax=Actinomadura rubrisoli TaxID=2530368 RepID=A0A4R5C135_9ACTN|nr:RidA family protein [Actinomadura rubrisoli]TDD92229.1 RidA family protein [Actinomadura rubrisoli]
MFTTVEYVNPDGACEAQGLYSHLTAVPAGTDLLFVAGQLSVGGQGEIVGIGDFAAQFAQVHRNLEAVLTGAGVTWNHIIQFRTYLVHSQDIATFMTLRAELYPTLFASAPLYPPNTLLTVDRLVKEDFLVEIEAIVAGPSARLPHLRPTTPEAAS